MTKDKWMVGPFVKYVIVALLVYFVLGAFVTAWRNDATDRIILSLLGLYIVFRLDKDG